MPRGVYDRKVPGNGQGGRKKGARKKKKLATDRQLAKMRKAGEDPKEYIIGVMSGTHEYCEIKFRAAEVLMPYCYSRMPVLAVAKVEDGANMIVDGVDRDVADRLAKMRAPVTSYIDRETSEVIEAEVIPPRP